MSLFRIKYLFLFPTILTAISMLAIFQLPHVFTAPVVALLYWAFGSSLLLAITRMLQNELDKKSQIAAELEQQKHYLENLIESAPEAIVWADKNSNVKYINKKFTEIFGFNFDEASGQNIDNLLCVPNNKTEAEIITKQMAEGNTRESEGIRYRNDGTPIHVSIVGAPMMSLKGNLEVFAIYRDISEEKKSEQKLIESERSLRNLSDQLMDANNFKELLLDIITHDLRNPAGVIAGSLELLEEGESTDQDILSIIRSSSENLFQVIENASTLSKLSMGESISMEELDIVPLIRNVASTFNSQLMAAGMTLTIDLPASIKLTSNNIFSEVVSNFISNAIKYAASGKQIELKAIVEQEIIRIELHDYGKTIPEDARESIFNRKVQLLDGPRKGSGLGLAIVKRIAVAHNAKVGVKANKPQGNIFYFQFDLSSKS